MLKLTAENFQDKVIRSESPVMVEFYSNQCSKCAMMEEVMESLEKRLAGKVKVGRVEIEKSAALEKEYQIEITPTFMVFNKGRALGCMIGMINEETIEERIEEML